MTTTDQDRVGSVSPHVETGRELGERVDSPAAVLPAPPAVQTRQTTAMNVPAAMQLRLGADNTSVWLGGSTVYVYGVTEDDAVRIGTAWLQIAGEIARRVDEASIALDGAA